MRFTPTHSGPDSAGVVRFGRWEFEGRSYLVVVAGAVLGLFVFILAVGLNWPIRVAVAAVPLLVAVAGVKFFLVHRPPHFAGDWWEGLLVGPHFVFSPDRAGQSRTAPFARAGGRRMAGGEPRRSVPPRSV